MFPEHVGARAPLLTVEWLKTKTGWGVSSAACLPSKCKVLSLIPGTKGITEPKQWTRQARLGQGPRGTGTAALSVIAGRHNRPSVTGTVLRNKLGVKPRCVYVT